MTGVRIYDPAQSITYRHPGQDPRTDVTTRRLSPSQYPPPLLPVDARYPRHGRP